MPDLAVEIVSPSQTLEQARRKARVYLRLGTELVWLVRQAEKTAEAWTVADGQPLSETVGLDGELSGGAVLPGFDLPLRKLFRD
jgi:Uma2 family endonuclease